MNVAENWEHDRFTNVGIVAKEMGVSVRAVLVIEERALKKCVRILASQRIKKMADVL